MRKPFFKVSYDYALDNSVTEHGYIGIYTRTPECRLCKFAYSSEFGFSVPRSNKFYNQSGADSTLSFEIDGYIFTRRLSLKISVKENSLFSLWSPFKGIKVETTLIPIEGGHILHRQRMILKNLRHELCNHNLLITHFAKHKFR